MVTTIDPGAAGPSSGSTVQAILFDINGTIIDIETEDWGLATLRQVATYLRYLGIASETEALADLVHGGVRRQLEASPERHPEFDAVALWRATLDGLGVVREDADGSGVRAIDDRDRPRTWSETLHRDPDLALHLAQLQRALSRRRLRAYPEVEEVLAALRPHYRLAIVSDAQRAYARTELAETGLARYFDAIIVSGEIGYRKPDPRIFQAALEQVGAAPHRAIFVGNDMARDIVGAAALGMRTIFTPTRFGAKDHPGSRPDYVAHRFGDVLDAIRRLDPR